MGRRLAVLERTEPTRLDLYQYTTKKDIRRLKNELHPMVQETRRHAIYVLTDDPETETGT